MSTGRDTQVFGPGRPAAAVRAIAELVQVRAMLTGWDSPALVERYRRAVAVRAMYPDYGDTFRGH